MQINNTLNSDKVEKTIEKLANRIFDRFPHSGLGNTCKDFHQFTLKSKEIIQWIAKPNFLIRSLVWGVIILAITLLFYSFTLLDLTMKNTLAEVSTVLEASLNNIVLVGAAIFFLFTLEKRWKRIRAIKFLNEIRGFAHVVDMHQLTKDPQMILDTSQNTDNSPHRELNKFELQRYLDYCAEFFALIAKVAALYSQSIPDEIVLQSSNEIETLCSNMANKVWQKLIILNEIENKPIDEAV